MQFLIVYAITCYMKNEKFSFFWLQLCDAVTLE